MKSASISGRTNTESVLSTKARASTAGEDAEPIYIEDEDDTKGLTNSMTRDSSASSSRSNLVIDMSPTSTTEPQKAFKRSHSKSSPTDPKAIDDVINSVIAGTYKLFYSIRHFSTTIGYLKVSTPRLKRPPKVTMNHRVRRNSNRTTNLLN